MTDDVEETSTPRLSSRGRSILIGGGVVGLIAAAVGAALYVDSLSSADEAKAQTPSTNFSTPKANAPAPSATAAGSEPSPTVTAPTALPTVNKADSKNPFLAPAVAKKKTANGPAASGPPPESTPTIDPAPGKPGAPGQDGKDGKDGADGKDGKDGKNASLQILFLAYVATDADAPNDNACTHNPEVPGTPPAAPYPVFIVDTGDGTLPCYIGVPGRFLSAERGSPASWIKYSGLGTAGGVELNDKAVVFLGDETYTLNLGEPYKAF